MLVVFPPSSFPNLFAEKETRARFQQTAVKKQKIEFLDMNYMMNFEVYKSHLILSAIENNLFQS